MSQGTHDVHPAHARSAADGRTRDAVVRLLLERGPTTAATLADQLQLSGPGVRRHLDALCAEGTVSTRDAPASGKRGRPARQFLLTTSGRARAGRGEHGPADLAVAALRRLGDAAGDDAVRAFARDRALSMVGAHREHIESGADRAEKARRLAGALTAEGYAATSRGATTSGAGEQLCQHHCPVADVAAEFPQLCEAEAEVFAELLGTHVQRLATIARGDAACTTHVPAQRDQRSDAGHTTGDTTESSSAATTTGGAPNQGRQVV